MGRCWLLLAAGGVGPGFWRLLGLQTRLQLCRCLERVPRRRYLMLEFPSLAVAHPPQHIAEIGCGCGSGALRCWLRRAEARARGLRLSIRPEPHRVALCSLQRCSRCSRPTPPAASPAATSAPQRCTCSAVPGSRLGCSRTVSTPWCWMPPPMGARTASATAAAAAHWQACTPTAYCWCSLCRHFHQRRTALHWRMLLLLSALGVCCSSGAGRPGWGQVAAFFGAIQGARC